MSVLLKKILFRNGYSLEEINQNEYKISLRDNGNQPLNHSLFISGALVIFGIIMLSLGYWGGIISLISSIPFFLKNSKRKQLETDTSRKKIHLSPGLIKLTKENNQETIIPLEQIKNLNYYINKDEKLSEAGIELKLENEENIFLFEIYSADKRYLQDDIEKIAKFITDILNA